VYFLQGTYIIQEILSFHSGVAGVSGLSVCDSSSLHEWSDVPMDYNASMFRGLAAGLL